MKLTKEELKFKNKTTWSYVGFIFQTFFKRPFGYIIAALYVLYLSIILLIVPAACHLEPLFIWSNAAINMSIFNLFFIAAASGALAVAVFRTGRDDGTELALSAKPITKNTRIFGKVFVYLAVMLGFTAITVAILALIWPVFGEYDIWTNITGITHEKYVGLLMSILIGNIVNMLLFGGIAVLISMVGGQVITIVASVGIAFLMVLLNIIFPMAISSPLNVLHDKYNTSINSMVTSTRSEFNKGGDSKVKNYATIQCTTEQDGTETIHFDTNEYWTKVNKESGIMFTNYIDFGKQLSYLYNAFGVDQAKLEAASKLMIGLNNSNYYSILPNTHITIEENLSTENYPFAIYSLSSHQGVSYPIVNTLAGTLDVSSTNWYAMSTILQYDFNALIIASDRASGTYKPISAAAKENIVKPWYKMSDIALSDDELKQAEIMFNKLLNLTWTEDKNEYQKSYLTEGSAAWVIANNNNNVFWEGGAEEYKALHPQQKLNIVSKIQMAWCKLAQDQQIDWINKYCKKMGINDSFPFSSKTVKSWYLNQVYTETKQPRELYYKQKQIENLYKYGIFVSEFGDEGQHTTYSRLQSTTLEYCETYNNLYQYKVTSFYNVNTLIAIWTILATGLFTTSIIIYKKTDFK